MLALPMAAANGNIKISVFTIIRHRVKFEFDLCIPLVLCTPSFNSRGGMVGRDNGHNLVLAATNLRPRLGVKPV